LNAREFEKMEDAMSRRNQWTGPFSAFAIGLGVGAALGVLFAPQPGDDTRDYLLNSAKDGLDEAAAAGKKLTRRAQDGIDQAKGQVLQATAEGERAYREARSSSS
jgi:gas vesicle protein